MRPSPKLHPTAWDALVVLCVAALAVALALFQWRGGTAQALTAVVSVDGAEVDRFPPEDLLEGPRTYTGSGYTLEAALGTASESCLYAFLMPFYFRFSILYPKKCHYAIIYLRRRRKYGTFISLSTGYPITERKLYCI